MAAITYQMSVRVRGAWRIRLVAALLRVRVYIPGSFDWASRGLRAEYRIDNGKWRDVEGTFHLS